MSPLPSAGHVLGSVDLAGERSRIVREDLIGRVGIIAVRQPHPDGDAMTEATKSETRSTPEKYLPYVAPVAAIVSPILALFTHETALFLILAAISGAAFLFVVFSWKAPDSKILTQSSNILGSDGNPIELPIFRG